MGTAPAIFQRPWLQAQGIRKVYDGTVALDGVDFEVERGAVHALIGENGAGKSTLMKILAGIEVPTAGRLVVEGRPVRLRSSREALSHGIGIIHQELNLCPNLSVLENIFLGRERTRHRLLDIRREEAAARAILERLEHPIDPRATVADLPLGQQQIVEIARALVDDIRVLIMDEPTSALSGSEVQVLFRVIRDLSSRGVGIVYISHRLEELLAIGDAVTVLRDGRVVAESPVNAIDVGWIVERMVGRSSPLFERGPAPVPRGEVLRVEELTTGESPRARVRDVSFRVRAGEILGIFGLMGSGRTELLEALAGVREVAAGRVLLDGQRMERRGVAERIAGGMILVPEDRQGAGVVPTLCVGHNLALASLRRRVRAGRIRRVEERDAVRGEIERLRVRTAGLGEPIAALSGGNQQKVVIGRALLTQPRVLLLDEPARGIDVAAKAEIFRLMDALASDGVAVVFVSSEARELLALSDRILVMSEGEVAAELSREEASTEALLAASARRTHGHFD
jgi:erythritol transport system ATP-binding protein